ncbi:sensor histidine kinase [Roseiconus nitratireducens]|nr:HAMP domain-containing sensor histidine kinase [Roseiconus nitratireducens]
MNAVTSLRHHAKDPSVPGDLGWWGVLPPLKFSGGRWWLPLSDRALTTLTSAMLDRDAAGSDRMELITSASSVRIGEVAATLRRDPPLLMFALAHWSGGQFVAATDLAQWLIESSCDLFSGGEWLLAAPRITAIDQRRWSRLMSRCWRLQPSEWVDQARDWLEVLGPEVPEDWLRTWPSILWDDPDQDDVPLRGSMLLQSLAERQLQRSAIDGAFSEVLERRNRESAQQLAYGLSHEINNPLANISARAQQLQQGEADPQRAQSLAQIVQQVYRAHEMIAGLMFYANPPEPNPDAVDLNAVVRDAVDDFAEQAEEQEIQIELEPFSGPATVQADRAMVLEAVRVLIRNAVEAVGEAGTVVVTLRPAEFPDPSEPSGRSDPSGHSGPWEIRVADSGPGLDPQAARHAFDPFYSGREAGRGLGLGLCRAYRIAALHDATIELSAGLAGCVARLVLR